MFTLKVENKKGELLNLTDEYIIEKIDGLAPPSAAINTSTVGTNDGTIYNSARVENRNIVITARIKEPVEANRIKLYRFFKIKDWCRLYFKNGTRDVYIDGYTENLPCDFFENGQKAQISVLCNYPFFKDVDETKISMSQLKKRFTFPFSIETPIPFSEIDRVQITTIVNEGDVDTGLIIELTALGEVTNPAIYSDDTLGGIKLNIKMTTGEKVVINTHNGEKAIYLEQNGKRVNYIRYLEKNPEWFQLLPGENHFTYRADSGGELLDIAFRHTYEYEGV